MSKVYTVRSSNLYGIEKMFRRLQTAAKRNGWPAPTLKVVKGIYATFNFQSVVDIEIDVPVYSMDGWSVVGELTKSGKFLEYFGAKCAPLFAGEKFACQHCDKLRKRNSVFALIHESGEHRLVGSSCIDEFTGVLNAEHYTSFLQKVFALAEGITEEQKLNVVQRAQIIPTPVVSMVVCAAIRTFGFVEGHSANATHKVVLQYLETGEYPGLEVSEDDALTSEKLVEALGGERSVVFVAALPQDCRKISQKLQVIQQAVKPSEWVGRLGEKVALNVKFVEGRKLAGAQWDSWLYKGYTVAGELITVFSSKELVITVNSWTQIHGNVKKHDEYKGVKSTVLNYVKVF